jgi:hypothetical protein
MVDVPDEHAPFRKIIDSTLMLTLARFAMPMVVGLLGWLFSTMLSDLKSGQRDGLSELKTGQQQVWTQMGKLSDVQTANSIALGTLSSKVDGGLKQLDHLQMQVDGLQRGH